MKITVTNSRKLIFWGIFNTLAATMLLIVGTMASSPSTQLLTFKIGLLFLVIGFLITILGTGFYFLAKKGSNVFAVNLVFFYLGLIIISLPIFLLVLEIQITDPYLMGGMIISGVILAILGFFGEYAQLNQWFLAKLELILKQLTLLKNKINWKLVFHPANFLFLLSFSLLVARIQELVTWDWWIIIGLVIILELLNLLLLFPEIITTIQMATVTFILVLVKGFKWSLLHLDDLLDWMKAWTAKALKRLFTFMEFFFKEKSLLFGSTGILVVLLLRNYLLGTQILLLVFVILMTSLLLASIQHPMFVQTLATESRVTVFKIQTRIQERRKSRALKICHQCSLLLKQPYPKECPNCSAPQYICIICNGLISPQDVVTCPFCQEPAHQDHMYKWLSIKSQCPHCRRPIQKDALRKLPSLTDEMVSGDEKTTPEYPISS